MRSRGVPIKRLFRVKRQLVNPRELGDRTVFHYSLPVWHECGDGKLEDAHDIASAKVMLSGGEVLVSRLNPEKGAVIHVRSQHVPMVGSTEFIVLEPLKDKVHGRLAYYLMLSSPVRRLLEENVESATQSHKRTRVERFLSSKVQLSDPEFQGRIADFLDRETARIEELIKRKQRMHSLLDDMEQALLETLVKGRHQRDVDLKASDSEWIGNIPRHWQVAKLTHVARLESGHTPNRSVDEYWIPEECTIPWFTLADVWQLRRGQVYVSETAEKVSPRGLANSAARLLPAGTVILSRTASVGFPGILAVPMATSQDFVNWVCGPQLRPKYLYYVLHSMRPEFSRLVMGSTHQTLYMPVVRAFRIPLPPIREQDEIVFRLEGQLDKLHRLRELNAVAIERLKELRAALITAAVTGKIDVETWRRRGETERRIDQVEDDLAEG